MKCEQYWPEMGKVRFEDLEVSLVESQVFSDYVIRKFAVAQKVADNDDEIYEIMVNHFHYTAWPDFGVPSDPSSMLGFMKIVQRSTQHTTKPIVSVT